MAQLITGLDIGGAHLKAAQVTPSGHVVAALQLPCALWLGLDRLEQALAEAARPARADRPRSPITMTGELADLFPDRATGVARLVDATLAALPGARPRLWAGRHGFVAPADAAGLAAEIASANWLASAGLAAARVRRRPVRRPRQHHHRHPGPGRRRGPRRGHHRPRSASPPASWSIPA